MISVLVFTDLRADLYSSELSGRTHIGSLMASTNSNYEFEAISQFA